MLDDPSLDVLARCAIADTFDTDLFTSHLQTNDITLDALEARFLVAPTDPSAQVEGPPTRYRLTGMLANAFWELWQEIGDPDYVRELSSALSAHYAGLDGNDDERLRHLLLADSQTALALFLDRFRAADERFDLSECWNLLDILDDPPRSRRLPDALVAQRERCRSRVRVRAAWADDYRVTRPSVYLERAPLQQALGAVLDETPEAPWLVRLKGIGGTGKTTLVRWFTSRGCIAADMDGAPTIPCARIDGSATSTVELLERPWLLLIAAAARLGKLLDDRRFDGFLDEYDRFRDLLSPFGERVASALGGAAVDEEEVVRRFASETESLGPFVLILDNLDDLYQLGSLDRRRLRDLFAMLGRVHRATGGMRVVIACRYDFRDLLPDIEVLERDVIEVVRFEEQEVGELLRRAGIEDEAVVDAVTKRSDRLPVLVSGYAAVLPRGVKASAAKEILEAPGPVIAYIAERIIGQNPDPVVRWALQYSGVPVVFDREFFTQVMLQVLRESKKDSPVRCQMNRVTKAKVLKEPDWDVPRVSDHERVAGLWEQIHVVSRGLPWFKVVDNESHTFVEADRRAELRADVALHEATALLHHHAMAYYGDLCRYVPSDPSTAAMWPQWQRRRVFHAVHIDPDIGLDLWRQATDTARSRGRLEWAWELTAKVLADFGLPVPHTGDPGIAGQTNRRLLGPAAVYEMHVDLARTEVQAAGLLPGASRPAPAAPWPAAASYVLRAAAEARAECIALGEEAPHNPYGDILSQLESIAQGIEPASPYDRDWAERVADTDSQSRDAHLVLARHLRLRAAGRTDDAEAAYAAAFERARAAESGEPWVAAEAASWHLDEERAEDALRWCESGASGPERPYGPDVAATALLQVLRASALLELGRPANVLDTIGEFAADQPVGLELGLVAARAHLALGRPLLAVRQLREPDRNVDRLPADVRLSAALLEAEVNSRLLDRGALDECLDHAESLADLTKSPTHHALVVTARARAALDPLGDLTQAKNLLDHPALRAPVDAAAQVNLELARAAAIHMSDRPDPDLDRGRLTTCLDMAWDTAAGSQGSRSLRVRVLAAELDCGSSLEVGRVERALGRLLDELEEEPRPSRWRLLAPLAQCRTPAVRPAVTASAWERVSALFPEAKFPVAAEDFADAPGTGQGTASENDAWQRLALAELCRVVGHTDPMVKLRDSAVSTLGRYDSFVRWQALDAVRRVGAPPANRQLDPDSFAERYRGYPALVSAALTTWIETYDPAMTSPDSEELLRRARDFAGRASKVASQYSVRLLALLERQARAHGREAEADRLNDELSRYRDRLGIQSRTAWLPRTADGGQIVVRDTATGVRISAVGYAMDEVDVPAEAVWDEPAILVKSTGLARALDGQLAARGGIPTAVGFSWSTATLAARLWELLPLQSGPLFRGPAVTHVVRHDAHRGPERYRIRLLQRAMAAYWSGRGRSPGSGAGTPEVGAFDGVPGKRFERALRQFADELGLTWAATGPGREQVEAAALSEAVAFFRQRRNAAPRPLRVSVAVPAVGGSMSVLSVIEQRVRQVEKAYQSAAQASEESSADRLTVKWNFGPEAFAAAASYESSGDKRPCDILHVCGPLRAVEGLPLIGVPRDGSAISERELDALIRASTDVVPPVVVLDVLAPTSSSSEEVRRQMAQRNMFAHRLLALGSADTVIATGLERPEANAQPKAIATEFLRHGTPATACRAIRSATPTPTGPRIRNSATDAALPYEGTALFSGLEPHLICEPGLFVSD